MADGIDLLVLHTPVLDGGEAPPVVINYAGDGDYLAVGRQLAALLRERAELREGEAVLDVGCGIGRLATALVRDVPAVRYSGFDVVRFGITWCQKRFRGRPGFEFRHADVRNAFYNPRGRLDATTFRFPYPDAGFDLAVATSVVTHMPRVQMAHYLSEMARCLRPGGRAYVTCFLLDEEALAAIAAGRAALSFRHPVPGGRAESAAQPEEAMAFDPPALEEAISGAGLAAERFFRGHWRGEPADDFQDAWLLRRPD